MAWTRSTDRSPIRGRAAAALTIAIAAVAAFVPTTSAQSDNADGSPAPGDDGVTIVEPQDLPSAP